MINIPGQGLDVHLKPISRFPDGKNDAQSSFLSHSQWPSASQIFCERRESRSLLTHEAARKGTRDARMQRYEDISQKVPIQVMSPPNCPQPICSNLAAVTSHTLRVSNRHSWLSRPKARYAEHKQRRLYIQAPYPDRSRTYAAIARYVRKARGCRSLYYARTLTLVSN